MNERLGPDRRALLAFLEEHWRELTLRDALGLRPEALDAILRARLNVP